MPALGSHTYSRLNQTTNSSSQSHTSWRRSGSWQVAGSHGRGSRAGSPSISFCWAVPSAAR